jgi:hypothetical protein
MHGLSNSYDTAEVEVFASLQVYAFHICKPRGLDPRLVLNRNALIG